MYFHKYMMICTCICSGNSFSQTCSVHISSLNILLLTCSYSLPGSLWWWTIHRWYYWSTRGKCCLHSTNNCHSTSWIRWSFNGKGRTWYNRSNGTFNFMIIYVCYSNSCSIFVKPCFWWILMEGFYAAHSSNNMLLKMPL